MSVSVAARRSRRGNANPGEMPRARLFTAQNTGPATATATAGGQPDASVLDCSFGIWSADGASFHSFPCQRQRPPTTVHALHAGRHNSTDGLKETRASPPHTSRRGPLRGARSAASGGRHSYLMADGRVVRSVLRSFSSNLHGRQGRQRLLLPDLDLAALLSNSMVFDSG